MLDPRASAFARSHIASVSMKTLRRGQIGRWIDLPRVQARAGIWCRTHRPDLPVGSVCRSSSTRTLSIRAFDQGTPIVEAVVTETRRPERPPGRP